jgi:hypothetical protein
MDRRFEDKVARRINSYMVGPNGEARAPGMINFPLYGTATDVFARGRPPAELAFRIENMMALHQRPHLMPSFLDNHDVDRFLSGGTEIGLRQNLLMMMTLPGIPVIYYGTEQGFTVQRAAMFAKGWGSGGRDHFDTTSPLYRYIASLRSCAGKTGFCRAAHPRFWRGKQPVLGHWSISCKTAARPFWLP